MTQLSWKIIDHKTARRMMMASRHLWMVVQGPDGNPEIKIKVPQPCLATVCDYAKWKASVIHEINDAGYMGHLNGDAIRPDGPPEEIELFDKKRNFIKKYMMESIIDPVLKEAVAQSVGDHQSNVVTATDIMYAVSNQTRRQRRSYYARLDKFFASDGSEHDNLGTAAVALQEQWVALKMLNPRLPEDVYIAVMLRVTRNKYIYAYQALDNEMRVGNLTVPAMRRILLDEADRGVARSENRAPASEARVTENFCYGWKLGEWNSSNYSSNYNSSNYNINNNNSNNSLPWWALYKPFRAEKPEVHEEKAMSDPNMASSHVTVVGDIGPSPGGNNNSNNNNNNMGELAHGDDFLAWIGQIRKAAGEAGLVEYLEDTIARPKQPGLERVDFDRKRALINAIIFDSLDAAVQLRVARQCTENINTVSPRALIKAVNAQVVSPSVYYALLTQFTLIPARCYSWDLKAALKKLHQDWTLIKSCQRGVSDDVYITTVMGLLHGSHDDSALYNELFGDVDHGNLSAADVRLWLQKRFQHSEI
ncbi:major facilitator superfamily domain-containing protein [Purpureocillium lavendulum]|uniref:Major facilitator superfamily domain-containing protein n=1 Tax=Purpureocillium lavendulum TaxID=1247861 RepID=A0AB34FIY9_9HYPO|nr:major facilitator superfamily domain-containing protein [Purpureocillium lavendulum]